MNEELIKNGEAQFAALKTAAETVAHHVNTILIDSPTTLAIAQQQLSLVKEKWNAVEAIRKKLKQPSLDEGKAIDDLAKALLMPLQQALDSGKAKILAWDKSQQEKPIYENALYIPPGSSKGIRETMKFEVIDMELLPMSWLQPNDSAINAFKDQYKENIKDGDIINGVRFYKEKSVTIR